MNLQPKEEKLLRGILRSSGSGPKRQPPSAILHLLAGFLLLISLGLGLPRAITAWQTMTLPSWSEVGPAVIIVVTSATALFLYLAMRTQQAIQKRDDLIRKLAEEHSVLKD